MTDPTNPPPRALNPLPSDYTPRQLAMEFASAVEEIQGYTAALIWLQSACEELKAYEDIEASALELQDAADLLTAITRDIPQDVADAHKDRSDDDE
jgi:hypothetical protein